MRLRTNGEVDMILVCVAMDNWWCNDYCVEKADKAHPTPTTGELGQLDMWQFTRKCASSIWKRGVEMEVVAQLSNARPRETPTTVPAVHIIPDESRKGK